MGEDYFRALRPRSQTRITSAWGNALVDALNLLFTRTVEGDFQTLRAVEGHFTDALYVAGKPVIKDGDPITVADLGYDAQLKITQAIEGASATTYLSDIHGKLVQLSMDSYGNVGVAVAKPLDELGYIPVTIARSLVPIGGGGVVGGPASYVEAADLDVLKGSIGVIPMGMEHNAREVNVQGTLVAKGSIQAFGPVSVKGELLAANDISLHTTPPYAPLPSDINASGIDPNSPPWAPPDGWGQVVEFTSPSDLYFFNYIEGGVSVQGHTLALAGESYIENYAENVPAWERVAVCVKGFNRLVMKRWEMAYAWYYYEHTEPVSLQVGLYQVPGRVDQLRLIDENSGEEVVFNYDGDWIIFVLDYPQRKAIVYDRKKTVLASLTLSTYQYYIPRRCLAFWIYDPFYPETSLFVDWVAVK